MFFFLINYFNKCDFNKNEINLVSPDYIRDSISEDTKFVSFNKFNISINRNINSIIGRIFQFFITKLNIILQQIF